MIKSTNPCIHNHFFTINTKLAPHHNKRFHIFVCITCQLIANSDQLSYTSQLYKLTKISNTIKTNHQQQKKNTCRPRYPCFCFSHQEVNVERYLHWFKHCLYWFLHCLHWFMHCLYWFMHCLYWFMHCLYIDYYIVYIEYSIVCIDSCIFYIDSCIVYIDSHIVYIESCIVYIDSYIVYILNLALFILNLALFIFSVFPWFPVLVWGHADLFIVVELWEYEG